MPQTENELFYQLHFQTPGVAEAEMERDVRGYLRAVLLRIAGEYPATPGTSFGMLPRVGGLAALLARPEIAAAPLPSWLAEDDVDFYTAEFARTGLRGGLNWYRNIDRNWELLAPFADARVNVPALFIAGQRDPVLAFPGAAETVANLPKIIPHLRETMILPGCGHWTQQERPGEVNAAMIRFLQG